MHHLFISKLYIVLLILCIGCTAPLNPKNTTTPSQKTVNAVTNNISKVFGFDNQKRYAYCPSIIQEKAKRHIWFCGTEPEGQFIDHIYYIRGDKVPAASTLITALAPGGPGTWDSRHVCDPSVIKGRFNFNGDIYTYAMLYLGNRHDRFYNEIGVAFAKKINDAHWVKYPKPLIAKPWAGEQDLPLGAGKAWGVGQPSALSIDGKGKILVTYTIGDQVGTRVVQQEADLSNMASPQLTEAKKITVSGLLNSHNNPGQVAANADFALDKTRQHIYMTLHVLPNLSGYPQYISGAVDLYKMPYPDFLAGTGSWQLLKRIGSSESGFARNHNSGIGRDAFGVVPDKTQAELYFTVSRSTPEVSATPDNHAEWTYQIFKCTGINLDK